MKITKNKNMEILGLLIVIIISVMFLKGFDRVAGRGPKQISDGMKEYEEWKKNNR